MRTLSRSRKTQFMISLLCLIAFSLPAFSRQENSVKRSESSPSLERKSAVMARPEDAVAAFIEFFTVIDKDRDGKVTLAELLDAHNAEEGGAKSFSQIKARDTDKNGMISLAEGEAGVKTYLLEQVEQQFKSDGDGNGVLSLGEFALAVHDQNGEKLPGGNITKRQEAMFRSADADKDERYNRAEAIALLSRRAQYGYIGRRVAYRARIFDLDRDRRYDLNEFALIYGVKAGEPIPQAVLDKHNSKSFGAGNHNYYNVMMRLIHTPQAELAEIDQDITSFEKRHAAAGDGAAQSNQKR
jgi:Ca2+-binding EF-hand superfamily protein